MSVRTGGQDLSWRRRLISSSCHLLFYLALAAVTAGVLAGDATPRALAAAAAVALAAWYGYWNLWAPHRLARRTLVATYATVAAVLWLVSMGIDRDYGVVGVIMFAQVFGYLGWRAALAVVAAVAGVSVALGGFHGTLAGAHPLAWQGLVWGDAAGGAVVIGLVGLCVYLDRQVVAARADAAAAQHRAGVLAERGRLAADLHDTLTQDLAGVVMLLEAARESYRTGAPGAGGTLDHALATARDGLGEIRGLVWDLRPEALERADLHQALARLTDELTAQTGVVAETVVTGQPHRLPARIEVVLLRAAEESLANVRRHARAGTVTVTLSYIDDVVALDVTDDGVGLAASDLGTPRRDGGVGLVAMRERVQAAGGTLTIESTPGTGTSVAVQLPVVSATTPTPVA